MNVILYMAISANGMIAKKDDDTNWISQAEWNSYSAAVQKAGCLIVGRRTYEILTEQPEFSELTDVAVVVVSATSVSLKQDNHSIARSPQEAIALLENYTDIIVAGGGILNAAFMKENFADEVYLDIEPLFIGEGIPLFTGQNFTANLELIEQKQITAHEIQLHYKVVK